MKTQKMTGVIVEITTRKSYGTTVNLLGYASPRDAMHDFCRLFAHRDATVIYFADADEYRREVIERAGEDDAPGILAKCNQVALASPGGFYEVSTQDDNILLPVPAKQDDLGELLIRAEHSGSGDDHIRVLTADDILADRRLVNDPAFQRAAWMAGVTEAPVSG